MSTATLTRSTGLRAPLLTAGVVLAGTIALHLRDPHEQGSWGICPTRLVSGLDCPGCGGLRAVNDLTHFDLAGAASSNLFFVALIPALVVGWVLWVRRAARGERWRAGPHTKTWTVALLAVMVLFVVVRNLPGSWLAA